MRLIAGLAFATLLGAASAQSNFPPPPVPVGNPITAEKVLLGMALFWEEQLSSTSTVACGTCHSFAHGGTDQRASHSVNPGVDEVFGTADDVHGSPGTPRQTAARVYQRSALFGFDPQVTPRRAPSVINAGYQPSLFYDGRATNGSFFDPETNAQVATGSVALENLIAQPPLNPMEMGHPGRTWTNVAQKVATVQPLALATDLPARLQTFIAGATYPQLFQLAFGTPDVTGARIIMAVATYLRTLNSDQSPWDNHNHANYTLTPQEQRGLSLFGTPQLYAIACNTCHGDFEPRVLTEGPIVGQMTVPGPSWYYNSPTPTRLLFHNTGVRPATEDPGQGGGRFRIASLRNVALSAPYFHNGSKATLGDVIDFYDRGGDFPACQAPGFAPRGLSATDKQDLIACLGLLTDPRLANGTEPFDRPRLGGETGRLPTVVGIGSLLPDNRRARCIAPQPALLGEPAFQLFLDDALPAQPAFLMLDVQIIPGGFQLEDLEITLALTPALSAIRAADTVLTSPATGGITPPPSPTAPAGTSTWFPIPNTSALRGVNVYTQWLFGQPSATLGVATSEALRFTVL
jgi:cytochrome c peroxidase